MTATATATATRTRRNKIFHEQRKSSAHALNNLYISVPSAKYQHMQSPKSACLRTGKPTTSCLCSCFKLNRVRTGQTRFHEQKKQSKSSARVLKTLYTSYTPSYSHQHLSCLTTQRRLHTSHVMLKSRSGVVRDCRNLQPFAKLSR